jgi:ABC-type branched-subunit amino acid transport system ATPase component
MSKIKNLSREITVLLIEHNMEVALDLADRVTVLNVGQVVKEGTPLISRRSRGEEDLSPYRKGIRG